MPESLRQTVCDGLRFLVQAGLVDYNGHLAVRHPDGGFLINTGASNRAAMTPDQICHVGDDGVVIEGARAPNEVALHAAIFAARPDVGAVMHGHPEALTLLTCVGHTLQPVMPQASVLGDVPVYPHGHSISTPERGAAVAATLGARHGALLLAHGLVMTGADAISACVLALYAEQTARRQLAALPLGGARTLPKDEWQEYAKTLNSPTLFRKCWDFYLAGGKG